MNKKYLFITLILIVLLFVMFGFLQKRPPQLSGSNITFLNNPETSKGLNLTKAIENRSFTFPKDLGAHPEYLTEWWYYTGNLLTEDGRHFGYQLTFFRRAISDKLELTSQSEWASNQIYLAHFAVTNTAENEHFVFDKISRGAAGIAGTETDPLFSIWLNDWEIIQVGENLFKMKAETEDVGIDLLLTDVKGISLNGNEGLSQKGKDIGNASYYFSQTRLETSGVIRMAEEKFNVNGFSWMDHEFGTSTLGAEQVGWDWFSIQLDDNTEIMLFQIRQDDGDVSQFSSGTLIYPNGDTESLNLDDYKINVMDTWQTTDRINYPSKWEVAIERLDLTFEITPVINNQEMNLFFRYWEGAVRVKGTYGGKIISGFGYVELTGYAQSMQGVF